MLFLILLIVMGFLQFVRLFRPEFGLHVRAAETGILLYPSFGSADGHKTIAFTILHV